MKASHLETFPLSWHSLTVFHPSSLSTSLWLWVVYCSFLWLFLSVRFDWSFLSEALLASLVGQWWICACALLIWISVEPIIPPDRRQLVTEEGVLLLALMAPRLKVPPQYQPGSQLHKWPACHLLSQQHCLFLSLPPPSRPNCCQMLLISDLLIDLSHVFKFVISVVMLKRVLHFLCIQF